MKKNRDYDPDLHCCDSQSLRLHHVDRVDMYDCTACGTVHVQQELPKRLLRDQTIFILKRNYCRWPGCKPAEPVV